MHRKVYQMTDGGRKMEAFQRESFDGQLSALAYVQSTEIRRYCLCTKCDADELKFSQVRVPL